MSGPMLTPKVIYEGVAYEALPSPEGRLSCKGCVAGPGEEAPPRGLCAALPCFSDDSPLGVLTIYKKVAE